MFRCDKCGWESPTMTVRCKGTGCGLVGSMRFVSSDTGRTKPTNESTVLKASPKPKVTPEPLKVKIPAMPPTETGSSAGLKNIVSASAPSKTPPTVRVVKPELGKQAQAAPVMDAAAARPVLLRRSSVGLRQAGEIQKTFLDHGLWLRSVQMKNCQCLTNPDIPLDEKTRSVKGLFADSWTYAHPSIGQYLFQMHPTEGKRAVALMVDWTKTIDRYVEYALKDMSSNKRFADKDVVKPDATKQDMLAMRQALANQKSVEHNEVRTCQVRKEALVGLIWSPILHPTAFSDGTATWEDSKEKFQKFVQTLQAAGAGTKGLPVFTYEVSGGMILTYLDFLA